MKIKYSGINKVVEKHQERIKGQVEKLAKALEKFEDITELTVKIEHKDNWLTTKVNGNWDIFHPACEVVVKNGYRAYSHGYRKDVRAK